MKRLLALLLLAGCTKPADTPPQLGDERSTYVSHVGACDLYRVEIPGDKPIYVVSALGQATCGISR